MGVRTTGPKYLLYMAFNGFCFEASIVFQCVVIFVIVLSQLDYYNSTLAGLPV